MKTIFLASILALAALTVHANSTTSSKKVSYNTNQSFLRQFGNVENVTWSEASEKMTRATFNEGGEEVSAFFNVEGEFIASTVNRSVEELPMKLRTRVKSMSDDTQVLEVIELQSDKEHVFYVKIKDAKGEKILKGYSNGYLSLASL